MYDKRYDWMKSECLTINMIVDEVNVIKCDRRWRQFLAERWSDNELKKSQGKLVGTKIWVMYKWKTETNSWGCDKR